MKRDIIAKLLAEENLTVISTNDQTASFDVKNRILRLPSWNGMSDMEEILLKIHETGHALYTPLDMDPAHRKFHASINIVEDARIERMMKDRYRGATHAMRLGYKGLIEKDFFGINGKDLSKLNIMDKINLHFKIGDLVDVPLTELEENMVARIEKADDYSEVVELAYELYNHVKDQREKEQEEESSEQIEVDKDPTDEVQNSGPTDQYDDPKENESQNSDSDEKSEKSDENSDEDESKDTIPGGLGEDVSDEDFSETQNNFDQNLGDRTINHGIYSAFVPKNMDSKNLVIDHATLYSGLKFTSKYGFKDESEFMTQLDEKFTDLMKSSKKSVGYLAAEFNRRKSAKDYRKSFSAKTGDLDVNKVWQHQFNDNIFKTNTVTPKGKNHGFIMYVDWSGSMYDKIFDTVKQTIMLAQFARRINVPFEVFAFTDRWHEYNKLMEQTTYEIGELSGSGYSNSVNLMQVLSSTMSNNQFKAAAKKFLGLSIVNSSRSFNNFNSYIQVPDQYELGSTPLNAALARGLPITERFVKDNRIEKLNIIVLSDGEDTNSYGYTVTDYRDGDKHNPNQTSMTTWRKDESDVYQIHDQKTHITYDIPTSKQYSDWRGGYNCINSSNIGNVLLDIYKDRFGASVTGIFVSDISSLQRELKKSHYRLDADDRRPVYASLRKRGYAPIISGGYDTNFFVVSDNNQYEEIIKPKATKTGKITKAAYANSFKKSLLAKSVNKNMLSNLAAIVA